MQRYSTIFLIAFCLFAHAATAQVDSFSKGGIMYYTYDAAIKPVRNFYPKNGLRLCPYCGEMQTEAHIKEVAQTYAAMKSGSSFFFIRTVVSDTPYIKRKYSQK